MNPSKTPSDNEKKITSEKPISLAGVDFKKLLSAFLKVKPEGDKESEKKNKNNK